MKNTFLAEVSRESINNIVKAVKNPADHPNMFSTIFECILHYIDEYKREIIKDLLIKSFSCKVAIKEDADHSLEYIKVFRCFGSKFVKTIIYHPTEDLQRFLFFMIELTSNKMLYNDGRICNKKLFINKLALTELEDFWQAFFEEFHKAVKKDKTKERIQNFQNVFERLILIALNRMEMTEEQFKYLETQRQKSNDDEYEDDKEDEVDYDLRDVEEKQE